MASKKNQAAQQTADAPQAAAPQQDAQQTADAPADDAGAAEVPAQAAPAQPAAVALPTTVTLASPYGFFDDDGVFHGWAADQVVTDPTHIELLIARGAPLAE